MLAKRVNFNSLKADSENLAALMCLTGEMDVTQNMKDKFAKCVCLMSCAKEIYINKAIAMMRRKSPLSENIYLIENHCQANISKGRRGKSLILFS